MRLTFARSATTAVALTAALALPASAQQSGSETILGTANIFAALGNAPVNPGGGGPGTAPNLITLDAGAGRTLRFGAIVGDWGCAGGTGFGPEGGDCAGAATNVGSTGSIAGIQTNTRTMFLVGLFLEDALPAAAPARLTYSTADLGNASFAPAIGQVFFIGDGRTGLGSGAMQAWAVPDAATRLYLGVADAFGFNGPPGWYQDNPGSVTARYAISVSAVPEPSSLVLAATGLVAVVGIGARRRRQG